MQLIVVWSRSDIVKPLGSNPSRIACQNASGTHDLSGQVRKPSRVVTAMGHVVRHEDNFRPRCRSIVLVIRCFFDKKLCSLSPNGLDSL